VLAFGDAQAYETRVVLAPLSKIRKRLSKSGIKSDSDVIQDRPLKGLSAARSVYARNSKRPAGRQDRHCGHSMKRHATVQPGGLVAPTLSPARRPANAFVAADALCADQLPMRCGGQPPACAAARQLLPQRPRPEGRVEFPRNVQTRRKARRCVARMHSCGGRLNRLDMQATSPPTPINVQLMPARCRTRGDWQSNAAPVISTPKPCLRRDPRTPPPGNGLRGGTRLPADTRRVVRNTPIAGLATLDGDTLHLRGRSAGVPDGSEALSGEPVAPISRRWPLMGVDLAQGPIGASRPRIL